MPLEYIHMRMNIERTVIDLSGRVQYDVDGITTTLWGHGYQSRESMENMRDTDLFWSIVDAHETPAAL